MLRWRRWWLVGRIRRPWSYAAQVAAILAAAILVYLALGRLILH